MASKSSDSGSSPPSSVGSFSGCVLSYVTTILFESARRVFHVMWLHALSWHESFTTHVMYDCDDVLGTALLFCVDFINGL
jgi:hypothetical protein